MLLFLVSRFIKRIKSPSSWVYLGRMTSFFFRPLRIVFFLAPSEFFPGFSDRARHSCFSSSLACAVLFACHVTRTHGRPSFFFSFPLPRSIGNVRWPPFFCFGRVWLGCPFCEFIPSGSVFDSLTGKLSFFFAGVAPLPQKLTCLQCTS